jgi:hypothetical protein
MFQFAERDQFITQGLAKIYSEAAREPNKSGTIPVTNSTIPRH